MTEKFLDLTRLSYSLLDKDARVNAGRNVLYSALVSVMEAFSLAACFPLFYALAGQQGNEIPEWMSALPPSWIPWWSILIFLIILFVCKNSVVTWLARRQLRFADDLYLSFAEKLYRKFYKQPWMGGVERDSADAFRRIRTTPFDFANHIVGSYLLLITDVLTCTWMLAVVAWLDYRAIVVVLVFAVPLVAFFRLVKKKYVIDADRSFREISPRANTFLSQGIDSVAEAKVYQKQEHFIRNFIDLCGKANRRLTDLKIATAVPSRFLETVGVILIALLLTYGKLSAGTPEETIILLGLLTLALYRIIPSLNRMFVSVANIQSHAYSVHEIEESLRDKAADHAVGKDVTFLHKIEAQDLGFSYPGQEHRPLLDDVRFRIGKGDFVLLGGASGAGKTTLLNILSGLIDQYDGEIRIDDLSLSAGNISTWQKRIGLVTQNPTIFQGTILENIAFGEEPGDVDHHRAALALHEAGLGDFVRQLALKENTLVGDHGLAISGGQRQMLALARALYRRPDILLLDEVTNHLDDPTKRGVLSNLRDLVSKGVTVVLASHDATVREYASRYFVLADARIVEVLSKSGDSDQQVG